MEILEQDNQDAPDLLAMEDYPPQIRAEARFMGLRLHHVMRTPNQLISFAKLLLRWRHNSFYVVSTSAGLKAPQPDTKEYDHDMRLRIAKRIAVKTTPVESPGKGAPQNMHELVVTLAKCKQDPKLKTFPLFCKYFNLLYFDLADVEAMERRFPEILLTDPRIQNLDPLFTTTKENLSRVALLALYYWHCITGNLGESVSYIDRAQEIPSDKAESEDDTSQCVCWKLNDGIHYPSGKFKKYTELSEESVSPTLPFEMPSKFKRSRKNDIREYRPLVEQLEALGIDDVKNRAKIVYSLFSQLSHGEIGRMFPASLNTITSKQTDRDRGRWLLGLH